MVGLLDIVLESSNKSIGERKMATNKVTHCSSSSATPACSAPTSSTCTVTVLAGPVMVVVKVETSVLVGAASNGTEEEMVDVLVLVLADKLVDSTVVVRRKNPDEGSAVRL